MQFTPDQFPRSNNIENAQPVPPPQAKTRHWTRNILIAILILCLLAGAWIYVFPGTAVRLGLLNSVIDSEDTRAILKVRQPKVYDPSGNDISYPGPGLTINLPWDISDSKVNVELASYEFTNGKKIILNSHDRIENYEVVRDQWKLTPNDIAWLDPKTIVTKKATDLILKDLLVSSPVIYEYQIKDYKVLQAGDPGPESVMVTLFTNDNFYTILFANFNQNEIDYTISNMQIGVPNKDTAKLVSWLGDPKYFEVQERDKTRLKQVRELMTALELFYNDNGGFPPGEGGSSIAPTAKGEVYGKAWQEYMPKWPQAPLPIDAPCNDTQNRYSYTPEGELENGVYAGYELSFCLGSAIDGYLAGVRIANPSGIK